MPLYLCGFEIRPPITVRYYLGQLLPLWIGLLCLIPGHQGLGPAYRVSNRFCTSQSQCNVKAGEICKWIYEGCDKGQCMCNPGTHIMDTNGMCVPQKLGGEKCSANDLCSADGMTCQNGVCRCVNGRTTPDGEFCLRSNQKLLGEKCVRGRDTCFRKSPYGYVDIEVRCSISGECSCANGYKQDGIRCRKWKIGEYGCQTVYQCMGGALCLNGFCQCPNTFHAVAGNTKCAKRGAITNLPISAYCDEIGERRYCDEGLVCSTCGKNVEQKKCIKYLISDEKTYINAGNRLSSSSHIVVSVFLATVLLLSFCVINR